MIDRQAAKFIAAAGIVALAGNASGEADKPARAGSESQPRATRVLAEGAHATRSVKQAPQAVAKSSAQSPRSAAAKPAAGAKPAVQAIRSQSQRASNVSVPASRRVVITSANSALRDKAQPAAPRVQQRSTGALTLAQANAPVPLAKPAARGASVSRQVTASSAQLAQQRSVTRSSENMRDARAIGMSSQQIREGREVTRSSKQMRENAPKPTRSSATQRASADRPALDVSGSRDTPARRIVIRSANARG